MVPSNAAPNTLNNSTLYMASKTDTVPLICRLPLGKSENVYRIMWSHIIDICSKLEKVISCKNFHVDFEFSVHNVIQEYFPDCSKVLQISYRVRRGGGKYRVWDCVASIVMLKVTLVNGYKLLRATILETRRD